jgi:hypothetical protein
VAKVKVVNTRLDSNLNGTNFNNIPSETIFSFGSFTVTSNFDGRTPIDYTNELSSFVRPVTLETMGVTDVQSQILHTYATNAVLNLDKSDLNTFVRYGSAYEFLRTTIERIILTYPGSLFMNSQLNMGGNATFFDYSANTMTNTTTLRIPVNSVVNKFGLVYNKGNQSTPDDSELKNLNLSYDKYVVWSSENPSGNSYSIIGFTGFTTTNPSILLEVSGIPFLNFTGTSDSLDFHIKPNNLVFEEFRALLNDYQKYMISERDSTNGFSFILKDPTLLDDGNIVYGDSTMLWTTGDRYNIDIDTPNYRNFLNSVLTIGSKYDAIKTDLIARFLTPASLKTYDLTEEGKMTKLLRVYGREFDELRQFIDSLVNINKVTYDKINNIPDQLIKNLARTFGWDYFSLVNENELVDTFLTIDSSERNLNEDLLPAEIDIELWRRILLNTNYFWKSKGTREAIKSMFLLIGIPEPFINITEYVYTVDGKINPNTVPLTLEELPSVSLPYDSEGYPIAPIESNSFYFQVSGDTDSGQAYMDVFRMVGFNLTPIVDNKKSWVQTGATTRIDDTTPQYYQEDSKLVLNTKEVDVALDTARGIEYDVFDYIKNTDFPANSSGYTLPFKYINISLGVTSPTTFTLPFEYNPSNIQGDLEVRFNGMLMNGAKLYTGGTSTISETFSDGTDGQYVEYIVSGNTITLNPYLGVGAVNNAYRRDVIQATYIYSATTSPVTGITVQYIVTRINPSIIGTVIPLPSNASGDVQVTMNGIALTKGTPQFTADYIPDPANPNQIIIQNPLITGYLNDENAKERFVQVAYVEVIGSTSITARSEIYRADSFNTGKLYYNSLAGKFVYKLNYKVNNANEVKILIDGIALEPLIDYSINISNPYEIFLPAGIKYGSVISAYYLVGGVDYYTPIVGDIFGLGDISQLSFLEFIELIQRRMINARNRKTIADFKGGWYPTLLNIYIQYLKRGELEPNNPLLSNGYTFENLYSFLSKYNAFFQRFVDQLLSATIILKKGGLLIRNSVFTKQKFAYKRGVNLYSGGTVSTLDMRGMTMIQYLGDDGSEFIIAQTIPPPPPPPPTLYVETVPGVLGSIITGGKSILGYELLDEYGIMYKKQADSLWCKNSQCGSLSVSQYSTTLTGLDCSTTYQYAAFIKSNIYGYTGNSECTTTPAPSVAITLSTCSALSCDQNSIDITGGILLPSVCGLAVDYYGMQYKAIGTVGSFSELVISPTALTATAVGGVKTVTICSDPENVFTIHKDLSMSWVSTEAPEPPAPLGVSHNITFGHSLDPNPRSGLICYSAATNIACVCVCQDAYISPTNAVNLCSSGGCGTNYVDLEVLSCGALEYSKARSAGECFFPTFTWCMCKPATAAPYPMCAELTCNGVVVCTKTVLSKFACSCSGTWNRCVDYNDLIELAVCVEAQPGQSKPTISRLSLTSIGAGVGTYSIGSPMSLIAATCGGF